MMATETLGHSILERLREGTRVEHALIERTMNLMDDSLTFAGYREQLMQFRGFYKPVEDRLRVLSPAIGPDFDLAAREKCALIDADLAQLGVASPEFVPQCMRLPRLTDASEALGCLYVLEGATLGGRVICRHVRRVLHLTPSIGCRFFHGYGEHTGEMWRSFGLALTAYARNIERQDQVFAAAIATFQALRGWFESNLIELGANP